MNPLVSAFALCITILLSSRSSGLCAEEPASLLANFSFEQWNAETNQPLGWTYWSQDKEQAVSAERENPAHGDRSLRVYMPHNGMVQVQQYRSVQPRAKYRLTFATRGGFMGNVSVSIEQNLAGFYVSTDPHWNFREKWQTHSYEFDTTESTSIGVGFRFYGKGVIWVDSVVLEKL